MAETDERKEPRCPYLHEVENDVVCIYPQRVFCVGAEHGKPRFMSRATAEHFCAGDYEQCPGYQERLALDR